MRVAVLNLFNAIEQSQISILSPMPTASPKTIVHNRFVLSCMVNNVLPNSLHIHFE